ncbi:unnamed protein product [Adineta steineri]|uniref:Uncharacterized protein n=1 Tax=Adineta steineri TaxID=433720 RepID=A0A818V2V6_9BILA|nr:unnamed protein product [Adineta steineri]CAF1268419.1 unnamed protein product [Adineta steineri]CAF3709068.1 unnamed protein product [Adineta steineri]
MISSSIVRSQSIHLVTGLLVNHDHAWNSDDNRQDETGAWLLDPLLDNITKTVYDSDIFLTDENIMTNMILDRFAKQTWKEYILKSLSIRNDIDLRPIAQYKKSQECPYYITYIIDHYYDLPEIILFSHGRPQGHNPNIIKQWSWFIQQVQQDKQRHFFNSSIGYISSNCGSYVKRYTRSRPILDLLGYERTVDPLANQIKALCLGTYCCAQFIIHRSRILQHPISFWRLALKIVIDMNDCSHFEHIWHVLFGEPGELDQQKNLAVWYEQAHPELIERCSTDIVED